MTDPLLPASATDPDGIALDVEGATRTWADLEERSRRLAAALASAGIGAGDRIAVLARNAPEWADVMIGCLRSGVNYVPVNWHLTATEIAYLLDDSGARLLLCDDADLALAQEAVETTAIERIVVFGDELDAWLAAHPAPDGPDGSAAGFPLLYTGGTTGRSKGVVRSSFTAQTPAQLVATWGRWGDLIGVPSEGPSLVTTPLYHAFATAMVGQALTRGVATVATTSFDPKRWLDLVEQRSITSAPVVPTQIVRLVKLPEEVRGGFDTSSLRHVVHTAAPCPRWAKQAMIEWLGPVVWEFYGSSEGTGPVVATSEQWLERPGTIGRPVSGLEASVVDDDGGDLPAGEVGTLYFRRPDGAPEYHDDPEKTAASRLADGRFTVGDLGWIDDDGYLFLADRRVDLIISGGVNIYPAEIEAALVEHPAVRDAAVFGIPHPEWGQEVKAAVELDDSTIGAGELIAWCRERLAAFKCPKSVDVHDALPREAHGKLKKRLLRDPYWEAA